MQAKINRFEKNGNLLETKETDKKGGEDLGATPRHLSLGNREKGKVRTTSLNESQDRLKANRFHRVNFKQPEAHKLNIGAEGA